MLVKPSERTLRSYRLHEIAGNKLRQDKHFMESNGPQCPAGVTKYKCAFQESLIKIKIYIRIFLKVQSWKLLFRIQTLQGNHSFVPLQQKYS